MADETDDVFKDQTTYEGDMVTAITMRSTDSDAYPCGWKYSLHFGDTDGNVVLRYDNAHEIEKGHERHTADGVDIIDFPGMMDLYDRFLREVDDWWDQNE